MLPLSSVIATSVNRIFGDDSSFAHEFRVDQIHQLSSGFPPMVAASLLNSIFVGYLYYDLLNPVELFTWMALVWALMLRQLGSWYKNRLRPKPKRMRKGMLVRALILSSLGGLVWGALAIILFRYDSFKHEFFIAFLLTGQVAASTTWLSPFLPALYGYTFFSMTPLVALFVHRGEAMSEILALLIVSGMVTMLPFSLNSYKRFKQNFLINRERNRLLENLQSSQTELEDRVRERTRDMEHANVLLGVEIQKKERVEGELRKSEEKFRNIVDGAMEGILVERVGNALFCNPEFCRIFGYADMAAIQALPGVHALVSDQFREPMVRREQELLAGNKPQESYEFQAVRKDGKVIWLRTTYSVIDWEGKQAVQYLVIDITRSKTLESQLRQSQKMEAVGRLAGGMAHDFNNLLQVMMGFTEVALHRLPEESPALKYVNKVQQAGKKGAELTQRLLAFSRQSVINLKCVQIDALVLNQLKMLGRLIGKDIAISFNGDPDLSVYADSAQLEQMLINMLINARDAMPQGGSLDIRADAIQSTTKFMNDRGWATEGRYVRIQISDTGVGIKAEEIERIFEPFYTSKDVGEGTGLGLSMAYGIIQQHKGMIEVESKPGVGTVFFIYLPFHDGTPVEMEAADEKSRASGGKETLLIADDDENIRGLMINILEDQGYRVISAKDGDEALKQFSEHRDEIDLMILDVVMPNLGGRGVYEQLKAKAYQKPVIFCTGYSDEHLDAKFILDNKLRLVYKPYQSNDLLSVVREELDSAAGMLKMN